MYGKGYVKFTVTYNPLFKLFFNRDGSSQEVNHPKTPYVFRLEFGQSRGHVTQYSSSFCNIVIITANLRCKEAMGFPLP